ncbi:TetR family transcriptional regulator [Steroidobacter sp.]|uniref:TetR family transcriptional regulator n=1 Tax=Steroidobacter sp. TaxID=1978227 RepID=UPI001A521BA1|nr:TetR family transcriptional regulator [Steroidobacter sp.]MBL8269132.1 TetR family transcriptional regulator [Steroidobacter sp.]
MPARAPVKDSSRPPRRRKAGRIARDAVPSDFNAREKLLDTASKLMSDRHGINVSLSEIAAHSGLNSALVKYYFGNKEGLLVALVDRDAAVELQRVRNLLELDMSASEKLRVHIAGIINGFFRRPYLNRLMHSLLDQREAETSSGRHIARVFIRPLMELQQQLLEQGIQAGEFKQVEPVLFYVNLLGACDHLFNARYALQSIVGGAGVTDAVRERYIAHVYDIFVNGLRNQLPESQGTAPKAAPKASKRSPAKPRR